MLVSYVVLGWGWPAKIDPLRKASLAPLSLFFARHEVHLPQKLAQSPQRKVCGAKTSHNHPTEKSAGRKTRTITPPGSLWSENLAQTPHRKVCGAKASHYRSNGKSVERKPRTIGPTRRFWGEKLAQSLATEVFRPVVRRRISVILWLSLSLRLSVAVSESDGRPSAWGCLRGR